MANTYSAIKRVRQTERRTAANTINKSRLRTALRRFREAVASGDKQRAQQQYRTTISAVDRMVRKGVVHRNTAARYKSRLSARVAALG